MSAHVELCRDEAGKWRWRYVAANGRILADGGQGYARRSDCLSGCASVLGGAIRGPSYFRAHIARPGFLRSVWDQIPIVDLTRDQP